MRNPRRRVSPLHQRSATTGENGRPACGSLRARFSLADFISRQADFLRKGGFAAAPVGKEMRNRDAGGTATLFVKAGDEYVRVATNVQTNDGSRAIGTILDPNGPAIE